MRGLCVKLLLLQHVYFKDAIDDNYHYLLCHSEHCYHLYQLISSFIFAP